MSPPDDVLPVKGVIAGFAEADCAAAGRQHLLAHCRNAVLCAHERSPTNALVNRLDRGIRIVWTALQGVTPPLP